MTASNKRKRNPPIVDSKPPPCIEESLASSEAKVEEVLIPHLRSKCQAMGLDHFFPVQRQVIPLLLKPPAGDICVCAPTGSGKTLAYVIPLVQELIGRLLKRLRVLVLVPTRDLAYQVKNVFDFFCKGTDLSVGMITGQKSFKEEQKMLIKEDGPLEGWSKLDILISTPGRLIDHINGTRGFNLQHLKYLVVDEADRLLDLQSGHEWVSSLLEALKPSSPTASTMLGPSNVVYDKYLEGEFYPPPRNQAKKLLFSATLTRDPENLSMLELKNPLFITSMAKLDAFTNQNSIDVDSAVANENSMPESISSFALPTTLQEKIWLCNSTQKPCCLIELLELNHQQILCFTKSVSSSQRLCQLLKCYYDAKRRDSPQTTPPVIQDFSSQLLASERSQALQKFKNNQVNLLICTDLAGRGLDLENVEVVINYDVPNGARTYVHRVGRCARAGRAGIAWTLVERPEKPFFKSLMEQEMAKPWKDLTKRKDYQFSHFNDSYYQDALKDLQRLFRTTPSSDVAMMEATVESMVEDEVEEEISEKDVLAFFKAQLEQNLKKKIMAK